MKEKRKKHYLACILEDDRSLSLMIILPLFYVPLWSILFFLRFSFSLNNTYLSGKSATIKWNSSIEMDIYTNSHQFRTSLMYQGYTVLWKMTAIFFIFYNNRTLFFGLWKITQASNNIMFSKTIWPREYGVDFPYHKSSLTSTTA